MYFTSSLSGCSQDVLLSTFDSQVLAMSFRIGKTSAELMGDYWTNSCSRITPGKGAVTFFKINTSAASYYLSCILQTKNPVPLQFYTALSFHFYYFVMA